jgi:hypothetical protein
MPVARPDRVKLCPCCGGTRPARSLILCRRCWALLPEYIKREALEQAKTDRSSIIVGDTAATVIASVCRQRRGHLERAA